MRNLRKLVLIALLSAVVLVSQIALNVLPNIEVVMLLFFIYTQTFTFDIAISTTLLFSLLMGLIYGFGTWVIMYFVLWPFYVCIMYLFKRFINNKEMAALLLGFLGLIFGLLASFEPLIIHQSLNLAIAYFIKGIPFDLIHAGGNYILTLLLYNQLVTVFKKIKENFNL